MTAPKVLGVDMRERSAGPYPTWCASFGCVSVSITANCDAEGLLLEARVAKKVVALQAAMFVCVAAIERELLAIKSAIPDAPTTGGDDGEG